MKRILTLMLLAKTALTPAGRMCASAGTDVGQPMPGLTRSTSAAQVASS